MSITVHTIETPSLGDRSYLAVYDGWAIAVDVQRDLGRVEHLLERDGLRLAGVVETHIHNDYLTGGLALARRHRSRYVVPRGPKLGYSAERADDDWMLELGPFSVRAIETPGHTDAHITYSLHLDGEVAQAAFTGGSLLLGSTGRTDLLGPEQTADLARQQWWSARRLARVLGPQTQLLPTHGFGSFCSAGSAAEAGGATITDQLRHNVAFALGEAEFTQRMTQLGAYPDYYQFMGPRNAGGVDHTRLAPLVQLDLNQVAEVATAGEVVIDVRPRHDWMSGHLPGSINVDAAGAVATWLGWLYPIDTPLTLVAQSTEQLHEVRTDLHRIGFDQPTRAAVAETIPEELAESTGTCDFATAWARRAPLLDVREEGEWRSGHILGARHLSAHQVPAALADPILGADLGGQPLHVHCGVGFRAAIAVSTLLAGGVPAVLVDDALGSATDAGWEWCPGTECPPDRCTQGEPSRQYSGAVLRMAC